MFFGDPILGKGFDDRVGHPRFDRIDDIRFLRCGPGQKDLYPTQYIDLSLFMANHVYFSSVESFSAADET